MRQLGHPNYLGVDRGVQTSVLGGRPTTTIADRYDAWRGIQGLRRLGQGLAAAFSNDTVLRGALLELK
jgi:hypothetical protein